MSENLVSIIMPCHNGEKFISESIESVLSQTYTNWELLIINDNSSDDSVKIINKYTKKDSRIKFLDNPNCTGTPATPRNVGMQMASGRFIAFLDCDDKWLPTKLKKQLPFFVNEQVAVVFSYYQKINEDGEICSAPITSPDSVTYKQFLNGDCIGNLTGIYDTKKVGKVFQKEIHAEDYLFWLEILQKGFIAKNTNSIEGYYRISSNSTSANKLKSAKWNWNIYRNELQLPLLEAIYHFCMYTLRGVLKFIK